MILFTVLTFAAFVLSLWSFCTVMVDRLGRIQQLQDIRGRLRAIEIENVQLRIRVGEQELYPTALDIGVPEREQFSLQIGKKQVFGVSKERPRRK